MDDKKKKKNIASSSSSSSSSFLYSRFDILDSCSIERDFFPLVGLDSIGKTVSIFDEDLLRFDVFPFFFFFWRILKMNNQGIVINFFFNEF